jgi:hypothetical protein
MPVSRNNRPRRKKRVVKKQKVSVAKLLSLLPDEVIAELVEQTQADKHVKRLPALLFVKLLLYGVLKSNKLSTHLLEHYYNSEQFALLTGKGKRRTRHSSLSDRLKAIKPELFRKLLAYLSEQLQGQLPGTRRGLGYTITSFDSTMVAASAVLLKEGMQVGQRSKSKAGKKQVKFSVSLHQGLPCRANTHCQQAYLSEDLALGELLLETEKQEGTVLVFDRGVSKRATFEQLTEQQHLFVTRLKTSAVYQVVSEKKPEQQETDTLRLQADLVVRLKDAKGDLTRHPYRLIKALSKESGEELWFLSNLLDAEAEQITELYRQRWQIEVFFKFLKQHLGLECLLSYDQQAIEVMLQVRLIAAMLILLYKQANGLGSYKLAKEKFVAELEMELIKQLIKDCGGNPALIPKLTDYQKVW